MLQFMREILFVISELTGDLGAYLLCFLRISNEADASEDNDGIDVQRPVAFLAETLIHDTVTNLVA